ncbi:MAG: hypothetical protein NWS50_02405 [Paracoccaceae bacterium]|nr:hypothetical protein [Paracoccaceae bacterium]
MAQTVSAADHVLWVVTDRQLQDLVMTRSNFRAQQLEQIARFRLALLASVPVSVQNFEQKAA